MTSRDAGAALRSFDPPFEYKGFVEGDDVGQGVVDVVVTEGFAGNIALKTAEGTAKQIGAYLRAAMNRSLLARLGAFLAQDAFRALSDKMDPRHSNGGVFLGLKGIVIKSHGGTDATGLRVRSTSAMTWRASAWSSGLPRTFKNITRL